MTQSLPDFLEIQPFTRPCRGTVALPGSKSLTNRALLLAALCEEPLLLTGALLSEDTRIMAEALRRLGYGVDENASARVLRVGGSSTAKSVGTAEIFVGLAGTAARFLTAFCAAAPQGAYRIDGVPQMRKRPMKGLIAALRCLGAEVTCIAEEDHFPIEIRARGLRGGPVGIDASESSQMLSALLMVSPRADKPVEIGLSSQVREPFVRMTRDLMTMFGVTPVDHGGRLLVPKASYRAPGRSFAIEPDATAASYFAALPIAVGGGLDLPGLLPAGRSLQGDIRFMEILSRCGVQVSVSESGLHVSKTGKLAAINQDFSEFSDTFLTLGALASLLPGVTRISGIAHTRKQETDRVSGMAHELRRLGQEVVESDDSLDIHPRPLRTGQTVETYSDHRFAMSFGILGSHDLLGDGRPWLTIQNPACCAKTFPDFFEVLEGLRKASNGT